MFAGGRGQFRRRRTRLNRGTLNLLNKRSERDHHLIDGAQHQPHFILARHIERARKIAAGHLLRVIDDFAHGIADVAADPHGRAAGRRQAHDRHNRHDNDRAGIMLFDFLAKVFSQRQIFADRRRRANRIREIADRKRPENGEFLHAVQRILAFSGFAFQHLFFREFRQCAIFCVRQRILIIERVAGVADENPAFIGDKGVAGSAVAAAFQEFPRHLPIQIHHDYPVKFALERDRRGKSHFRPPRIDRFFHAHRQRVVRLQ